MKPADARARRQALKDRETFDADERTKTRESTPVKIAGVTFTRRRKDWAVSRLMRMTMRDQEKLVARSSRLRNRIGELEAKQVEAAIDGDDTLEAELEQRIDDLVKAGDDATEAAEVVTYRLLALLLVPPDGGYGEHNTPLVGFGPDEAENEGNVEQAIAFLQPALDVEDAAALAAELSGSREADPTTTNSSETGSAS